VSTVRIPISSVGRTAVFWASRRADILIFRGIFLVGWGCIGPAYTGLKERGCARGPAAHFGVTPCLHHLKPESI
jgi:hypothetical protein